MPEKIYIEEQRSQNSLMRVSQKDRLINLSTNRLYSRLVLDICLHCCQLSEIHHC